MPYAIMVSEGGRASERTWDFTGLTFENGQEAGSYAKSENAYALESCWGNRERLYRAVKISGDDPLLWRQREQARIDDGTYKKVPWCEYYSPTDMCEHVDPNDATKVRFTATNEDGLAGRYTSMAPGRFIRRYLDSHPSETRVDRWCAAMGLDDTVSPLMYAKTPEEIVAVYNDGPHSCMAYRWRPHEHPFHQVDQHPVVAYGDSDIQVAYIMRRGDITARCVVWPEKKIYGRIYGDNARLEERLKQEGYTEDWDGFAGAKIRQVRTADHSRLIIPYIDGDLGVILDGEDWLVLSATPHIIAKSPYGVASALSCQFCGANEVHLVAHKHDEDDDEPSYICAEGCNH